MTILSLPITARALAFPCGGRRPKVPSRCRPRRRIDHRRRASPIHREEITIERAVALIFGISDLPVQLLVLDFLGDGHRAAILFAIVAAAFDAVLAFRRRCVLVGRCHRRKTLGGRSTSPLAVERASRNCRSPESCRPN